MLENMKRLDLIRLAHCPRRKIEEIPLARQDGQMIAVIETQSGDIYIVASQVPRSHIAEVARISSSTRVYKKLKTIQPVLKLGEPFRYDEIMSSTPIVNMYILL